MSQYVLNVASAQAGSGVNSAFPEAFILSHKEVLEFGQMARIS